MTIFFILYFICGYFACGYTCNLIYTMKYPEQKDKATLIVFLIMWPMYLGLVISCIMPDNKPKKKEKKSDSYCGKYYIYSRTNIGDIRYEIKEHTIERFDGENWIKINEDMLK